MSNAQLRPPMLSSEEIHSRRAVLIRHIRDFHRVHPFYSTYYLVCNCTQGCDCIEPKVGRIILPFCGYPGELDWLELSQPLAISDNVKVFWHCIQCDSEFVCGTPWLNSPN